MIKNDREGMSLDFRMALSVEEGGSHVVEPGAENRRGSTRVETQVPSGHGEHTSHGC